MYRETIHTTRYLELARRRGLAADYGRRNEPHRLRTVIGQALVKYGARLGAEPLRAPLGGGVRP